ncbi:MAG: hypothetical protein ABTQ27_16885 [Amaricoccus sp.]|uniref:hypothetical protein n=1 Tax=Amaricoccus sp. TaxID=1872485 RepID=UPI0033156F59
MSRRDRSIARSAGQTAFASDGTPFDPSVDDWSIRSRSRKGLNFARFREITSPALIEAAKRPFRLLVETRNLNSVFAAFQQFRSLLLVAYQRRDFPVDVIDAEDMAAWIARGNARYIGQIKLLFDAWRMLKAFGVEKEVFDFLNSVRAPTNDSLAAVRTWDPDAGPYRPAEDAALKVALDNGFNEGLVGLYGYALARTLRGLGMRPVQLASMKLCDLQRTGGRVEMHIPLAKQRGVPERGAFMPWKPITQGLADILFLHVSENVMPRIGPGGDPELAPLFPVKGTQLLFPSSGFEGHPNSEAIQKLHSGIFKKLGVISPLTGEPIVVNPRRERHTVLTSLAMNGCNSAEIAANAGHVDLRSCEAYVEASIDHFQRMERLVGEAFIPIADRFLGTVVRQEADTKAAADPDAILLNREMAGVGSCQIGGCNAVEAGVAPVACYTCRKFRAWADAPHEALLEALLTDQERLLAEGHAEVAETRTATIVAISDLLEAIKLREGKNV